MWKIIKKKNSGETVEVDWNLFKDLHENELLEDEHLQHKNYVLDDEDTN